jgi:hypothetical protein
MHRRYYKLIIAVVTAIIILLILSLVIGANAHAHDPIGHSVNGNHISSLYYGDSETLAVINNKYDQQWEKVIIETRRQERVNSSAVISPLAVSVPVPQTAPSPAAASPGGDVWTRLAICESNNTNANTGNGYYGYFQFSPSTWASVGGTGLPSDHGYGEQLARAQILQSRSGWGQWPGCKAKLGL